MSFKSCLYFLAFYAIFVTSNAQNTTKSIVSDIQDVLIFLNPKIVLNTKTPVNTEIATIQVVTFSNKGYKSIKIIDKDPYFYLDAEKLYLKRAINSSDEYAIVTLVIEDLFNPFTTYTKYFLLPIKSEQLIPVYFDVDTTKINITIPYELEENSTIVQIRPLNSNQIDNYEYSLIESNNYLQISKDGIISLKKKLGPEFLKEKYPYIELLVNVKNKTNPSQEIRKNFYFKIDVSNQKILPPIIYSFDILKDQVIIETDQNGNLFYKLGQFILNNNTFPSARYTLESATINITLDDNGNLYIPEDNFNQLNSTTNISINIVDKQQNTVVFNEIFEIDIPNIQPTTRPTTTTRTTTISSSTLKPTIILECTSNRDCNQGLFGPNICLILSNLKNEAQNNNNDLEYLFRRLQFISNKDSALMLKYYRIIHALISPSKNTTESLAQLGLTINDLNTIGVCLCDSEYTGFKCQNQVINLTPNQCNPQSTIQTCNPYTSECVKSELLLYNIIQIPYHSLNAYKSYYCRCTTQSSIGLNCEFLKNQCLSTSISNFYDPHSLNKCKINEFCMAHFNNSASSSVCLLKDDIKYVSNVNYLTFDESCRTPQFINNNNPNINLNITDPSVLINIQNFIRDQVLLQYLYKNYQKIPKGPLAILNPSINMPDVLNDIRAKINNFTLELPADIQQQLTKNRTYRVIELTLMNLIKQGKLPQNLDYKIQIENLYKNLNTVENKNYYFSTPQWSLEYKNPNINDYIKKSLETLMMNSLKIDSYLGLNKAFTLSSSDKIFLDLFNFTNKPYNLVKLDILPGIYLDPDGELSIRPTPGIFLQTDFGDSRSDREFIFMPGIFNPASTQNCDAKSIFIPGVFSHQIDNFDLDYLTPDINKYLNKFIPMQIPFNINGFLTPYRTSLSDTILKLMGKQSPDANFESYILWTPLDLNPDSSFDIINKNEKFMNNLFSSQSLNKVVNEQKNLNIENLTSTLILSDPSMISQYYASNFNLKCISNDSSLYPLYRPHGIQIVNIAHPFGNVSILEFIVYDQNGHPIPQKIVYEALDKFCRTYLDVMNEIHSRICRAKYQTDLIIIACKQDPFIIQHCQNCDFLTLAYYYYNPKVEIHSGRIPTWLLFFLFSLLAFFWLLWLLLLCCCCLKFCPLYGLCWGSRKSKVFAAGGGVLASQKSFKYFGGSTNIVGFGSNPCGLVCPTSNQFIVNDVSCIPNSQLYCCNNQSNVLFMTKRISLPRACSLVDINDCRSSKSFICEDLNKRSISFPCLATCNVSQNDLSSDDCRKISNKCLSGSHVDYGNTKNMFEMRRIENHCGPNPEVSFHQACDNQILKIDRKMLEGNKICNKKSQKGYLVDWLQETDSTGCSSSSQSVVFKTKKCFFCNTKLSCTQEVMECEGTDLMLICDYCYDEWYTNDYKKKVCDSTDQESTYYIVRNKPCKSDTYGSVFDVVNLETCSSISSAISSRLGKRSRKKSCDSNIYDEISQESKNCRPGYKSNVHSLFRNNKIIVVPTNDKNESFYYLEDSDQQF